MTPFESRWEALEELERSVGSLRIAARTDNIALHEGSGIAVVRIGTSLLREQAWWRYGRKLIVRQVSSLGYALVIGGGGVVAPLVALGSVTPAALIAVPYLFALSHLAPAAVKTAKFGWTGWKRPQVCLRCNRSFDSMSYYRMGKLHIVAGKRAGDVGVRLPCPKCKKMGIQLNSAEAELFIHRYLAHRNMFGATVRRINAAAAQIEEAGSSAGLVSRALRARTELSTVDRIGIVALEMALNDEMERWLLQMKAEDLEAKWREAEVVAAIADGELTEVVGRKPTSR